MSGQKEFSWLIRIQREQLLCFGPQSMLETVDSALKDMAIVTKQHNRAEEAIEAIKSLRNRCIDQAQESLDNILLDLYKDLSTEAAENLQEYFRTMYKKVTEADIEEFEANYSGSDLEKKDLKNLYTEIKGNMNM
ncbi:uncharacterized protein A4U43_C08F26970 [Asparagus officinalis]|nr:uncharacterized protein A4U43_C08F26970 [Asparagus officinalis]